MASNSGVKQPQQQQQQQQFQQQSGNPHHCKECGLFLNSAESLEVHLQYHKENLLNKWATQGSGSSHSEETNNNNTTTAAAATAAANNKVLNIKREFISNTISAAADSSDSMFKNNRASPDMILGHPPTPQSYNSSSSPYQNPDNSFSPGFQNYQTIKTERASPNHYQQSYHNFAENQFYMENAQMQQQHGYPQEYPVHKMPNQTSYRYHPYHHQQQQQQQPPQQQQSYERNPQVSSSSPAYPPQPTPSPSPKQCDKCGYVCESASQLIEHLNVAHPPTPSPHLQSYQQNQHYGFGGQQQQQQIKTEEDAQSEILDLDSHKVHQVYQEEESKRVNGDGTVHNPHSVSAMLSSWPQQHAGGRPFPDQKLYQNGMTTDGKIFQPEQKIFQPQHQMPGMGEFISGGVTTTTQDGAGQSYRPFEHMTTAQTAISSTQVPTPPTAATAPAPPKGANWKSNEARRPKTYNCTACNKWFTSSGHLKRHYNTTLHKNAVKSSGQPDPATLPISAHHHPAREAPNRNEEPSPGPMEDQREDPMGMQQPYDRPPSIPGLLQQSPNNPYDRPNLHNPGLHSPLNSMGNHNSLSNSSISSLSGASPPNGEAGPSAISTLDSRGLLSLPTTPNSPFTSPGFGMATASPSHHHHHHHVMAPMDGAHFQMYPNGSAPHVMQVTAATNSHSTTGELLATESQPLPSFAQIQAHRFGLLLGYGAANVGGVGPVTAPYTTTTTFYQDPYDPSGCGEIRTFQIYRSVNEENNNPSQLQQSQHDIKLEEVPYSPPNHNNNNVADLQNVPSAEDADNKLQVLEALKYKLDAQPPSPEKAHTKRDYEENTGSPLITSTVQSKQPNGLHKCFDCDKMFNKACYLTQHNKTFHSGDKPFKCGRCGKRFSCEKQYEEHTSKHAGDKPYKCDLCPKQFNHKTDLRRHMCLHTGQKPYACDTCGKGFIRKDHMLKHCETHARRPVSKVATVR